ncbi:MAG TPA: flagellar assembly protein FliW [Bryobacteraceae bacterium]|nr:flagellar assembly protein FliW [Bryobacteraceae bacterium]
MPECRTKYFETMEYTGDSVIRLPNGLPGFEQECEFVLIDQPINRPLVFVQSLATPDLCFVALPVLSVDPEYRLLISPEDLEAMGLNASAQPAIGKDVACLVIVSFGEDRLMTANLLAPLVINLSTRVAVQTIQSSSNYSHRHPLLTEEPEPVCS